MRHCTMSVRSYYVILIRSHCWISIRIIKLPREKVAKQPANAIGKVLNWNDLAPWRRDIHSKYISKGYRPTSTSFLVSFQSLLYIHNETVNIYTHLLPSLFTIPTAIRLHQILEPRYKSASIADITGFTCFFLAAAFSFAMSATFHLFPITLYPLRE
jgi:adiponectin receptor